MKVETTAVPKAASTAETKASWMVDLMAALKVVLTVVRMAYLTVDQWVVRMVGWRVASKAVPKDASMAETKA